MFNKDLAEAKARSGGLDGLVSELKRTTTQLSTDVKNADTRTERAQEEMKAAERAHPEAVAALRVQWASERDTLAQQRDREAQRAYTLQQSVTALETEIAALSAKHAATRTIQRARHFNRSTKPAMPVASHATHMK